MIYNIPGQEPIEIKNIVFDYNGTIAIDGKLIDGIKELINELSSEINFHIITADTHGSVNKELEGVKCSIIIIPNNNQDQHKLDYVKKIDANKTLSVGNGKNDRLMLKETILGIAILQDEGLCTEALQSADLICKSIFDIFNFFKKPNRLIATLRN